MKTFEEMMAVDVSQYLKERDDAPGKKYLPWAACLMLLHKHGATDVLFYPVPGPDGSTLRKSELVFTDKDKRTNRCYEVMVHIKIDEMEWTTVYPVLNGNNPVRDLNMNQLRVSNAIRRAFVKSVAERTGLGFSLWLDEDDMPPVDEWEDLSRHSRRKCRQRMTELITAKINAGLPLNVIADRLGRTEDELRGMLSWDTILDKTEKAISEMQP